MLSYVRNTVLGTDTDPSVTESLSLLILGKDGDDTLLQGVA